MAFLNYRVSTTPTVPTANTVKSTGLTNLDIDANFKSLDDAKLEKSGGTITGDVTLSSGKAITFTGSTSGTAKIQASATGSNVTITFPSTTGNVITSGDSGTVTTAMLSDSGVTAGSYGSSTAIPSFTVDSKGRITSASTSSISVGNGTLTLSVAGSGLSGSQTFAANQSTPATFTVTSNATSSNTASSIVFRDASGNFSANVITASLSGSATSVVSTVTGTSSAELVRGNMGDSDYARILVGATASNAGFLEIATADEGTEPVHVRQYTGTFTSVLRTATLLDASGDTQFPGILSASFSDERLKTKLGNIENALDIVMNLEGFRYVNNDLAKSFGYTDEKIQIGVSAQRVEEFLPEIVAPAPFDIEINNGKNISKSGFNYKTIHYERLAPVLIEAIKQQQEMIADLKQRLDLLQK